MKCPLLVLGSVFFSGCAHYYLPANHFESPEVRNQGWGRLEWASLATATDLTAFAKEPAPDPETGAVGKPQAQKIIPVYAFGYSMPVAEKMEIGIKIQPFAPLTFRYKFQFYGQTEADSVVGSWSSALVTSAGVLFAQGGNEGQGVSYYLGDLAVPCGYRAWAKHLFTLTPFLSFASVSGVVLEATQTGMAPSSFSSTETGASTSMSQYGVALGHQYDLENVFFRSEIAYLKGSVAASDIGGLYLGFLTGLRL